jgi:hypothetical protein
MEPLCRQLQPSWDCIQRSVHKFILDTTYINPTLIILGHDGSKTVAFGDFRDQLLLEFETRIYNNLKIKSPIPLTLVDVIPGQFRTTDYSLSEINQILSPNFLSWIGWNKLAYQIKIMRPISLPGTIRPRATNSVVRLTTTYAGRRLARYLSILL